MLFEDQNVSNMARKEKPLMKNDVLIIGAGQAGFSAAARLRKEQFTGGITLLGEEAYIPYQRPPLSKKYLLGNMKLDRLSLRKPAFYTDNDIRLENGCHVDSVDLDNHIVKTSTAEYPFGQLVITTGSSPRQLPASIGGDLPQVYTIRSIDDIDAIRQQLSSIEKLVIIGGGYIGLEAAAVFRQLQKKVTIIEAAERILQRVACQQTADYFRERHTEQGVEFMENTKLASLTESKAGAHPLQVNLESGQQLPADAVIVGIGADANNRVARDAGLKIDESTAGVEVNAFGKTSHPKVWAAGDCAAFNFGGRMVRLESVQNAIDQAENLACNLAGQETHYAPMPWFWSDQYDIKLQIAGLNTGYNHIVQRQGNKAGSTSNWYYRQESDESSSQLLAVDAINDAMAYMAARKLLEKGQSIAPEIAADSTFDLKTLIKAE